MICFATCVGYPDKLRDIAIPGIVHSMHGESYNHLTRKSNGYDIFPIYADLMAAAHAQKAEALVLMHDDLEFRDVALSEKIRDVFKDPTVAIVGCVGARNVKSLRWWEGDKRGYATDAPHGVHSYGFAEGYPCEVDSVDGMFLVLSPWAIENLTLRGLGYEGLHGYAEELCFQARSKGKRVVVARIDAFHHTKGGVTGDMAAWNRSEEVFAKRWPVTEEKPADPWAMLEQTPDLWDVEAMYTAHRGSPVSAQPHVMLATPAYNPPCLEFLQARDEVCHDLATNGVDHTVITSPGDSLVMRGRHGLMHEFLKSSATHLLFWDVDIAPTDPTMVRRMMSTGHEIIGGACPFRGETGKVVCNILQTDKARGLIDTDDTGSAVVNEVGTGFLLMARTAIVRMCEAYPELHYRADLPGQYADPMWALFDTKLVDRRFLSEDYFFCKLWRDLGERVHVFAAFDAVHWGRKGFRGSFMSAMGMREA